MNLKKIGKVLGPGRRIMKKEFTGPRSHNG